MNQKIIQSISQDIYRRFPEFAGSHPKVRRQPASQGQIPLAKSATAAPTYLLTYQSKASTAGSKTISRWVRVVVNEQGKILKITTSR